MKSKWSYIMGTITIGLIVGGTIYAIKKSKDAEKEENKAISLDEAREIVKEREKVDAVHVKAEPFNNDGEKAYFNMQDVDITDKETINNLDQKGVALPIYDGRLKVAPISESDDEEDYSYEVDGDPGYDKYENVDELVEGPSIEPLTDFYYIEEGINPKEDKTLRFEPSSVEAKHQFIRMELADWEPNHDVYRIMLQMFEFPFIPTTDGDEILRTQVIDYKVQFFGFNSKWNKEVSFADVVLHYARTAEFNCGESVQYWVEHFLYQTEVQWDYTSQQIDTLIMRLNSHSYFNNDKQTFGLFGLNRQSMDEAVRIANKNIDKSLTYDIEFNEFLKTCV